MIHLARWEDGFTPGALANLMRMGLRAARSCIGERTHTESAPWHSGVADDPQEERDSELGQIVVQQLAVYEGKADKLCNGDIEAGQAHECSSLRAEYYGVRVTLVRRAAICVSSGLCRGKIGS